MESSSRSSWSRALPWIALVAVWFLWGSTYIAIRAAVETIPPLLMAGVRYLIAGGLLSSVLVLWNRAWLRSITREQWLSLVVAAFALLVVGNGLLCIEERVVPAGASALLVATTPIWLLLIDAVLDRRGIAALAVLGLVLGSLGIVALVGMPGGGIPLGPALAILLGAFAWAAGSVYMRRNAGSHGNPLIPALEMLAGGVMLSIAAVATGEAAHVNLAAIAPRSIAGFWWLVGPGAIVGYSAYGYAVRKLPTPIVATYAYINPIVAVILGALVLGEALTRNVLVGGAAIVLAVIAIVRAPRHEAVERDPSLAAKKMMPPSAMTPKPKSVSSG
ncbi:MAG: EamA family transporter [bacterium]|nr:EamA family transporter [bacterium]